MGVGLIILCVVWATCIFICVALTQCVGRSAHMQLAVLAVALLLTISLWVKFKQDQQRRLELDQHKAVVYDYSVVGRTAVLVITATALLAGVYFVFGFHVTVPRRASRLPPWYT